MSSRASGAGGANGWSGNAAIRSRHSGCSATCARHSRARRQPFANAGIAAPIAKNANSTTCAASVALSKVCANAVVGCSATLIHRNRVRLTVQPTPMNMANVIMPSPTRRWRSEAFAVASAHW